MKYNICEEDVKHLLIALLTVHKAKSVIEDGCNNCIHTDSFEKHGITIAEEGFIIRFKDDNRFKITIEEIKD